MTASRAQSCGGGRESRGSGRDLLWARIQESVPMKHLSARSMAVICSLVPLAACMGNAAGNLGSTKTGDIANPATRGSPIDELRGACGGSDVMTLAGDAVVRRNPYLQEVTKT